METAQKKYYKWSGEDLKEALRAYEEKKIGINEISKRFQVPKPTILRHVKLQNKFANKDITHKGRPTVFSHEQEIEIINHILLLENHMFGLTIKDVRRLAYQLAEHNNIPHSFNRENEIASKRWFYAFKKRHPHITIRQPESTSLNRVKGFNRENVFSFYDLLEKIVDDNALQASDIFNVDETAISTVQKKAQKVVSLKGKRQVGAVTSGERGINTTAVCCASAAGQFIPPMLIFKRVRQCPQLADGAPAGSLITVSESGYINSALFVQWLQHFIVVVKPTPEKKVLLLLDGHTTHTKNLEALMLARNNGIIILQLPGHTTHRLQPLDVSFFKPLSNYYIQAVEKWLRANAGRQVTQYQVASLFCEAYERAATISNVTSGFRSAGIWPTDRNIFPLHLFEAAEALNERTPEVSENPVPPPNILSDSTLKLENKKNQSQSISDPQPSTSKTLTVTSALKILSPIPENKTIKKRQVQKAAEITSSPYKSSLEENIKKRSKGKEPTVKGKKPAKDAISKISRKNKVVKKSAKQKRCVSSSSDESDSVVMVLDDDDDDEVDEENLCAKCNKYYFDKSGPQVDWLQCVRCHRWSHETCISNPDICDNCLK